MSGQSLFVSRMVATPALPLFVGYFGPTVVGYGVTLIAASSTASDRALGVGSAVVALLVAVYPLSRVARPISEQPFTARDVDGSTFSRFGALWVAPLSNGIAVTREAEHEAFAPFYDGARRLTSAVGRCFYFVEFGLSSLLAALTSWNWSNGDTCFAAVCVAVLCWLFVASLVIVWPHRTRIDTWFALLVAATQALMATAVARSTSDASALPFAGWTVVVMSGLFFTQAVVQAAWAVRLYIRRGRRAAHTAATINGAAPLLVVAAAPLSPLPSGTSVQGPAASLSAVHPAQPLANPLLQQSVGRI